MKKLLSLATMAILAVSVLAGCGGSGDSSTGSGTAGGSFNSAKEITVISREASSGTRGAFDELMGLIEKSGNSEVNKLFSEAVIASSTDEVPAKVEVDKYAIGYTSIGAVNDSVKALKVDGVEATEENVKNGTYKVSRPFIIASKGEVSGIAADFIQYATSTQGQEIVKSLGFVTIDGAKEYSAPSTALSGKLTLSGSTSTEKVIEKLREEYVKLNPGVSIEVTYNGSGAGIKDAQEGKSQLALSSRELKDEEKAALTPTVFANDGIAVIVNKDNTTTEMTTDQIKKIFTGETRTWDKV